MESDTERTERDGAEAEVRSEASDEPIRRTSTGDRSAPGVGSASRSARHPSRDRDAVEQAQESVAEAYDRTAETLSDAFERVMKYGRENPGTLTLIAFGAGVGVGLVLTSALTSGDRRNRIMPALADVLSHLASEVLNRR